MPEKISGDDYEHYFTPLLASDLNQSYEEFCDFLEVVCDLSTLYEAVCKGQNEIDLRELVYGSALQPSESSITERSESWKREAEKAEARHEANQADIQKREIDVSQLRCRSLQNTKPLEKNPATKKERSPLTLS